MKGLDLSRRMFDEAGLPLIERRLPECVPHIAAGLSGGSEAHGNDDEVSRDHSWGPRFVVWLVGEDYRRFSEPLRRVLEKLPTEYLGYTWRVPPPVEFPVFEAGQYIQERVGFDTPPKDDVAWLRIPEPYLFEITRTPVFFDPSGEVTRRFKAFECYPEDVWRHRLSGCLLWCWEWGVKHLQRAEKRGHFVTAALRWADFATYAMKVGFLLNRTYAPYHKWLFHEFTKLPTLAPEVTPIIEEGFHDAGRSTERVERIGRLYTDYLMAAGYQPLRRAEVEPWRVAYPEHALLGVSKALQEAITTPAVRELSTAAEVALPPTQST